ncbi:conserved hypothetical protein [delta proteobacterium NaphS2]|nr:conserved hypothetical protein [delta proteobacterium NaphS2]
MEPIIWVLTTGAQKAPHWLIPEVMPSNMAVKHAALNSMGELPGITLFPR